MVVFGASGRTGRHVCELAAGAGWTVTAAVRRLEGAAPAPDHAARLAADVLDPASVGAVLAAAKPDVVISAIGGGDIRVDDEGVRNIADACVVAGVRRVIVVTSLGCGASRTYASERLLAAIGEVLAAKTRAETHLTALPLEWTVVRPGGLIDGEPNGAGALFEDDRVHGRITCRDLAALLVALARDDDAIGMVLSAVDEASLSGPNDPVRYRVRGEAA
ncbi:flavin reductase [Blastochloris viridis]|uniref:Flavin reductase n=2 Tax=Blastochloris viridis TaxID=1079 RepID=A0A182D2P5_BLAVI|nr:flavin reductase [Blastochloris viridis]